MTEHPILFSTEMVRAILDGQKTQTRRIVNPPPKIIYDADVKFSLTPFTVTTKAEQGLLWSATSYDADRPRTYKIKCPYGKVGDTLWVRETTKHYGNKFFMGKGYAFVEYKDGESKEIDLTHILDEGKELPQQECWWKGKSKWSSARFMFKWAARIWLEITNIRVERVQDISENNIISEGCPEFTSLTGIDELYAARRWWWNELWNSINSKRGYGWDKNPWVWAIEFKKITEPS